MNNKLKKNSKPFYVDRLQKWDYLYQYNNLINFGGIFDDYIN